MPLFFSQFVDRWQEVSLRFWSVKFGFLSLISMQILNESLMLTDEFNPLKNPKKYSSL